MPWIDEIRPEHPPGEEDLPAIFQALSLSPKALEQVKQLGLVTSSVGLLPV